MRLIILDINMPEMDGIELLRHLHSIKYNGQLVICSASHSSSTESAQTLAQAYGLSVDGFIRKPITKDKLDKVFEPILAHAGQLLSA